MQRGSSLYGQVGGAGEAREEGPGGARQQNKVRKIINTLNKYFKQILFLTWFSLETALMTAGILI